MDPNARLQHLRAELAALAAADPHLAREAVEIALAIAPPAPGRPAGLDGALLDSVHDAIIAAAPDRTVVSWNRAAESLYGFTAAEALGAPLDALLATRFTDGDAAACEERLAAEGRWEGEVVQRRRDGSQVHVLSSLSRLDAPDSPVPAGVVAVNRDLTRFKALEREVHQTRRMEAVGRLASGIAHDFNNILMGIIGCCRLAEGQLGPREPARSYVGEIADAAERGVGLVRQLLAFGRQRASRPEPVVLDELVGTLGGMLERLLGEDVRLSVALAAAGTRVLADPSQIEQVVMNLAVNAREAMPGGGTLHLGTEDVTLGPRELRSRPGLEPGEYAMLRVGDTGVGMPSDVAERAFEPFFTTKGLNGTGLGLSTVYALVRQLGGHVEVESRLGVGTTFTILLPRYDRVTGVAPAPRAPATGAYLRPALAAPRAPLALGTAAPAAPAAPASAPPAASAAAARVRTVLVVEDDALVRMTVRYYLEDQGYGVIEAAEPSEALALSDLQLERLDLVLTDMVMPGMSGRDMVRLLERRHPGLPAIYMSAYPGDLLVHEGRLEAGLPTLQKPFSEELLTAKLVDVFGG